MISKFKTLFIIFNILCILSTNSIASDSLHASEPDSTLIDIAVDNKELIVVLKPTGEQPFIIPNKWKCSRKKSSKKGEAKYKCMESLNGKKLMISFRDKKLKRIKLHIIRSNGKSEEKLFTKNVFFIIL